jgi:hypothetical protein
MTSAATLFQRRGTAYTRPIIGKEQKKMSYNLILLSKFNLLKKKLFFQTKNSRLLKFGINSKSILSKNIYKKKDKTEQ